MPSSAPRQALPPSDPAPASPLVAATSMPASPLKAATSAPASALKAATSDRVAADELIGMSPHEAEELRVFQALTQAEQLLAAQLRTGGGNFKDTTRGDTI